MWCDKNLQGFDLVYLYYNNQIISVYVVLRSPGVPIYIGDHDIIALPTIHVATA